MRESCKKLVGDIVWCRPPAGILVVGIGIGSHNIERCHRHESVGTHRSRISCPEIGRTHKRIHISGIVSGNCAAEKRKRTPHSNTGGKDFFHLEKEFQREFSFMNFNISEIRPKAIPTTVSAAP